MKADDRILGAARKAKGCPFQGSSRVRQPWQDLKASRALKTRPFRGPKVRILLPPAVSPVRTHFWANPIDARGEFYQRQRGQTEARRDIFPRAVFPAITSPFQMVDNPPRS